MNINDNIIDIINQMHKDFPYLNQLGYGLSFPAAIYLQIQVKKQLGLHLQILMANLNLKSPLLYKLQYNVELFRRSTNTNKTFSKFDKQLKLNNTKRKIYHYVLFDKENNIVYDPTSIQFGIDSKYAFGFFTKNFINVRLIINNKYDILDLLDMLSNRVALITDSKLLSIIDLMIGF